MLKFLRRPEMFRQRENTAFGDTLAHAFEVVVTPLIFGAIGYGLDRWLGWTPWLTISLFVFGFIGTFVQQWLRYEATMRRQDAEREAARAAERRPVDARGTGDRP